MPMNMKQYKNIDQYIESFDAPTQSILSTIRQLIKKIAPQAQETIAYGIPTFKLNGNLVHFAAYQKHIGFYPTSSGITAFKKELSAYKTSKGTVQFPIDKPVPYDLIKRIVAFRVKKNLE